MSRGRPVGLVLVAVAILACTPAARPTARVPDLPVPSDPRIAAMPSDPLSCTERIAIPETNDSFDAQWSDSNMIVISRIVMIPNRKMITGTEEDQRLSVLDLAAGTVRDLGPGSKPTWSASGRYLAYWRPHEEDLRIMRGDALAGLAAATEPDVQWVGDALYFFHNAEIRVWSDGVTRTVANVAPELEPKYPKDDTYFSADGQRFTMTRYLTSGDAERYLGSTSTGVMEPLGGEGTVFTQWAPVGHALLLRSETAVTLRSEDGVTTTAPVKALAGPVHGWTADGRLLLGKMSPTVPGASTLDRFAVFGDESTVAALPNLLGVRSFSPDGRYFMGVTRSGLDPAQLEVYRCGSTTAAKSDPRADTVARARAASIDAEPRRFVRPVSGAITQYVQGNHTGIDVSAPFGAIIVAADDGVVDEVGWVPVAGWRVCVEHAAGLESCDYHTSLPLVSIGDHVLRGQPVALVGMTGVTTAPHVHWEVKLNGRIVDPLKQ